MNKLSSLQIGSESHWFIKRIKTNQEKIHAWLETQEKGKELPLYSSVDVRDAGFKISVVDTNLFPAGFNNLCEHGLADAVKFMQKALEKKVSSCRNVLIVAEEHTRNTWYLENIRILQEIIEKGGFNVKAATFLTVQPEFCQDLKYVELETATGKSVKIHCFKRILSDMQAGREQFCIIILNNDLTSGIPDALKNTSIPIYPSVSAGWHSRLKSHHFFHAQKFISEFSKLIDVDPWFFSALFAAVDHVDINEEKDRIRLKEAAQTLFTDIEKKYKEHHINEKPFIFLKADSGTYGMGVIPIEDPQEIIDLNRKNRNQMSKGKGSMVISRMLLQEGVPTIYKSGEEVGEVCIYQIENNVIGGFYRTNILKGGRENLNSKGMAFRKMCPQLEKYGTCGVHHDMNIFDVYRILARLAAIAAHREIILLEAKK